MIIGLSIITLLYCILIAKFIVAFDNVVTFHEYSSASLTTFSIVIPFRNEAENLSDLLDSLYQLDYPKNLFEVILVDDQSTDNSVEKINIFRQNHGDLSLVLVKNQIASTSPKKDAITLAINSAQHEWIVTTDADCVFQVLWLQTMNSFVEAYQPEMIVAPVAYSNNDPFLHHFQILDFLSLHAATIAGFGMQKPFLCNGANLAYRKKLFKDLGGFEGNDAIASGDDIFFLEKVNKSYPDQLMYLKSANAIVYTKSQETWRTLIQQRLRWAAKTSSYNNTYGKITGLAVLLMNASIIVALVLISISELKPGYLIAAFIMKLAVDFLLIQKSAKFFKQTHYLKVYPLSGLLYPFFAVFIAVGSMFLGFKWKGRFYKK